MNMRFLAAIAGAIILSGTLQSTELRAPTQDSPSTALAKRLIEALNTTSKEAITGFIKADTTDDVPVDVRVTRFLDLAEEGAPFSFESVGPVSDSAAVFTITASDGTKLALTIELSGPKEQPKISRLRVELAPDATPPKDYTHWTTLNGLADEVRTDTGIPAIGIAVIKDGKLDVAVSGVREIGKSSPVLPDDPWSIGSIGKSMGSTVVGRLVEQGKLRFESTLKECLPGIDMRPEYENVTLEQMMHHRGGIPRFMGLTSAQIEKIVGQEKDPLAMRTLFAKEILSQPPFAEPGTQFGYSNGGYVLLAMVAAVATGESFEQLLVETVYEPLGLKHSFVDAQTLPSERPSGHVFSKGAFVPRNMQGPIEVLFAGAGAAINMSLADLAAYGQMHLEGLQGKDRVLKSQTIKRLHSGEPEVEGEDAIYAAGWGIRYVAGLGEVHSHNGSNGTFHSEIMVVPSKSLVIVAISNCGPRGQEPPSLSAVNAVAQKYKD